MLKYMSDDIIKLHVDSALNVLQLKHTVYSELTKPDAATNRILLFLLFNHQTYIMMSSPIYLYLRSTASTIAL